MSFVGPRPERPEFVADLTQVIPYYGQRHIVRPGLTGWAQVRYTYGASQEDALQKLQYDLYYIKNLSIGSRPLHHVRNDQDRRAPERARDRVGATGCSTAVVNAMSDRRGGLLPRQRVRRPRAARAQWDSHGEPGPSEHDAAARDLRRVPRAVHVLRPRLGRRASPRSGRAPSLAGARNRLARLRPSAYLRPDASRRSATMCGRAKQILEDASGQPGRGLSSAELLHHRRVRLWALDVLAEEGYEYDSSIFPIRHDRYGIPGVGAAALSDRPRRRGPWSRCRARPTRLGPLNLPVAGGGYFRLLPYWWTRWGIARVNRARSTGPPCSTCTRGRFDPDQPRLPAGRLSRFRHYRNLDQTEAPLAAAPHRLQVRRGRRGRRAHAKPLAGDTGRLRHAAAVFLVDAVSLVTASRPSRDSLRSRRRQRPDPSSVSPTADARRGTSYVSRHPDGTADHLWGWRRVFESVLGHRCVYLLAHRGGSRVRRPAARPVPVPLVRAERDIRAVPELRRHAGRRRGWSAARSWRRTARRARSARRTSSCGTSGRSARSSVPSAQAPHDAAARRATSEALWTALDRKIRNQVRKAQKEGLTVVAGGAELVDEFYAVFARNMRDLGTPVYPKALFAETLEAFPGTGAAVRGQAGARSRSPQASRSLFRGHGAEPVGVVVARVPPPVSEHAAVLGRCSSRRSLDARRTVFDFGRSSPGGGTHQFKVQWGALRSPMHWEYVLLSRPEPPNQGPSNPKFEPRDRISGNVCPLPVGRTSSGRSSRRHLP